MSAGDDDIFGENSSPPATPDQAADPPYEVFDHQPKRKLNGAHAAHVSAQAAADRLWRDALARDKQGGLVANLANLTAFLRNHDDLVNVFAYDSFVERVFLLKAIPASREDDGSGVFRKREFLDTDASALLEWFNRNGFSRLTSETMVDSAIKLVARANDYHPIRMYLEDVSWDGEKRIDGWLVKYCGVKADGSQAQYIREVSAKFLIGAVARAFRPGCKVDTVLILTGPQGIGKSTALRILCGDAFFGDNLPPMSTKDSSSYIRGKWIIELGELAAMQRSEVEVIKAFVSRNEERFRPAYGRSEVCYPRQCIFAGTSNRDDFLRDETGNRRFWPVRVDQIKTKDLARDRDQLWAEAVHRFNAGEGWWLDEAIEAAARDVQAEHLAEDPWTGRILEYLDGKDGAAAKAETSILDICADGLGLEMRSIDLATRNRVLGVITAAGWRRDGRFWARNRNRKSARYVPPPPPKQAQAQAPPQAQLGLPEPEPEPPPTPSQPDDQF